MRPTISLERWVGEHLDMVSRVAGPSTEDLLDAPEAATRFRLSPEAQFSLGVIVGAAGALELTPRELLDAIRAPPMKRGPRGSRAPRAPAPRGHRAGGRA